MSVSLIDLPTEVIAHIFSFVSQKKDRRNLALLCKKSHEIVRQQSKKHNHLDLTNNRKIRIRMTHWFEFEKRAEFPFQKLSINGSHVEEYKSLWQRHGAEITQMTVECGLHKLGGFGSKFKELFPNLKSLVQQGSGLKSVTLNAQNYFSEMIEDLHLNYDNSKLNVLDSTLELFLGLKRLSLTIFITKEQNGMEAQEMKDFLDKWLLKLEKITLSFKSNSDSFPLHLLGAFDGWANEKLSFDRIETPLIPKDIKILKSFFSVPRHIKTLEIEYADIVLDSNLCTLIDQNVTIDCLIIWGKRMIKLEGLINARGVKEIHIGRELTSSISSINEVRFTPEALLKVKEFGIDILLGKDVLRIPLFRNLRQLSIFRGPFSSVIGNEEIEFIVNNFPFLEHLDISRVYAKNGRPLANLQHLRSLEINWSPGLTDAFFDFGSQLPKLKMLSVSNAPDFTLAGVKSIVAYCPHIEEMEFWYCAQINEECIKFVAKNLFYIETIRLESLKRTYIPNSMFSKG